MAQSIEERMGSARFVILTLSVCLIGFVLLFIYAVAQSLMPMWANSLIQELASVLIISGSVAALSGYFTKADLVDEIRGSEERLRNSLLTTDRMRRIGNLGIVDAYEDSNQFDFVDFIDKSMHLSISLNDGRTWLSNNINAMKRHISKPDSETVFLLVNPESSYVAVLAERTGLHQSYQSEKIRDTCRRLLDIYSSIGGSNCGSLKIYFHENTPVKGVFISENNAVITDYTTSRPRIPVPLLVLANVSAQSYYSFVATDLKQLIEDPQSICVYHADKGREITNQLARSGESGHG